MFVAVNGVRLFTRRVGNGPLVVVLHGGPGAHHDYLLPQYDLLGTRRSLLYYDQRGGGQSPADRDVPVGWREHVADLEALRTHLAMDRLTLCGYSWGGLLALLYLTEHPGRIERLALVSPAAPTIAYRRAFDAEFSRRMASPEIRAERDALGASGLRERDPAAYQRRAFALSVAGYFRDPRDAQRLTPFRVTARTHQAVWDSLGEYDLLTRLRGLSALLPLVPSVVVHGTFDPIPIAGARALADVLGAPLIELPTGHCPHVEATDRFIAALDRFLPKQ
ncbi:MAG: alpha/beta fold hydrolase [Gemmatimonadales bacterium]